MNIAKIRMTFAIALVLILSATGVWAAGAEEERAAAADKTYVTDPVTGKAVSAPQYGGTLTQALIISTVRPGDAWFGAGVGREISGVVEKTGHRGLGNR